MGQDGGATRRRAAAPPLAPARDWLRPPREEPRAGRHLGARGLGVAARGTGAVRERGARPSLPAPRERERALRWDRDPKLPPEKPRKVRGGSSSQGWESGSVRGVDCRQGVSMGIIAVGRNHPLRVRAQEGGGESSRGGSSELPAVPSSGRWVIEAEQCRIGCWSAPFRFACQGRNRCIRIQYNIGVYDMISVSIISSLLYTKLWNL